MHGHVFGKARPGSRRKRPRKSRDFTASACDELLAPNAVHNGALRLSGCGTSIRRRSVALVLYLDRVSLQETPRIIVMPAPDPRCWWDPI